MVICINNIIFLNVRKEKIKMKVKLFTILESQESLVQLLTYDIKFDLSLKLTLFLKTEISQALDLYNSFFKKTCKDFIGVDYYDKDLVNKLDQQKIVEFNSLVYSKQQEEIEIPFKEPIPVSTIAETNQMIKGLILFKLNWLLDLQK